MTRTRAAPAVRTSTLATTSSPTPCATAPRCAVGPQPNAHIQVVNTLVCHVRPSLSPSRGTSFCTRTVPQAVQCAQFSHGRARSARWRAGLRGLKCRVSSQVVAHHHEGFWLDVSTLRNFFDINLPLAKRDAPLSIEEIHKGIVSRGAAPLCTALCAPHLCGTCLGGLRPWRSGTHAPPADCAPLHCPDAELGLCRSASIRA